MTTQFSFAACPLCHTGSSRYLCATDGFDILRCGRCATDYVFPPPDSEALRRFYDRKEWFEGGERGGYQSYDAQTDSASPAFLAVLEELEQARGSGLSILDVGCGYGSHLAEAQKRGWKCFGVEVSKHAREVAIARHGDTIFIAEGIEDLIPHEFDLIVLLDVIEHLTSPYELFFSLFSKGCISPKTTVLIATPNARCSEAVAAPKDWVYRHPPSHLVFYSAESLRFVLSKLHFSEIEVQGIYPLPAQTVALYPDEDSQINRDLTGFAGLICKASGSDFMAFMHERYVPGTWSKLAYYEHLPRYMYAKTLATDAKVLDFACGTGYGSAILAENAAEVVGIDIDAKALEWARQTHTSPNLNFMQRSDFGRGLPAESFDFVTCFEFIEHVDEASQIEAVKSFSRLLKKTGKLIISTPNPEVTAKYGPNPYHLREMNEDEFRTLLRPHFEHLEISKQYLFPSVEISDANEAVLKNLRLAAAGSLAAEHVRPVPAAFIAVCSHSPVSKNQGSVWFDTSEDYIWERLQAERKVNEARFRAYTLQEEVTALKPLRDALAAAEQRRVDAGQAAETHISELRNALEGAEQARVAAGQAAETHVSELRNALEGAEQARVAAEQAVEIRVSELRNWATHEIQQRDQVIHALTQSKLFRLRQCVLHEPFSGRKLARIAYLSGAMMLPVSLKRQLLPYARKLKQRVAHAPPEKEVGAYRVCMPKQVKPSRKRVVHALANFMTGGSSRLVVDLIERLGHLYEQEIITSYVPDPPAYLGPVIREYRQLSGPEPILEYFRSFRPDMVHVHYWGDVDQPWYDQIFKAAESYGCKIVENVNTPVHPYLSDRVDNYVYVSKYVLENFGQRDAKSRVIHPGSNFDTFTAQRNQLPQRDCIGMVYRLEPDKLNERSIDVFIKVVTRRPHTKVLVVGGGSFLEPYKAAVAAAGLSEAFTFTGYVPYEELPRSYAQMTLFVAPVWKESFGQVSPFAMSMGIPVVGYDIGALHEIIGTREFLAPPGDSDQLADIIIDLLNGPDKVLAVGRSNKKRAQSMFSVEAMIDGYLALYKELVS